MAVAGSLMRLKNAARCDTVRYTDFDDLPGSEVVRQTPDRPNQTGITVVPPLKTLGPRVDSFDFQFVNKSRPEFPELRGSGTRLRHAESFMKPLLPFPIERVLTLGALGLARRSILVLHSQEDLKRIGSEIGICIYGMLEELTDR
jgi:hypothetical protein